MHFILHKREKGQIEFGIIYGGIVFLALLAGGFLPVLAWAPQCAFKALTGAPCPTCGATRAIVYLSHGQFVSALAMNPLVGLCAITATLFLPYSLVTLAFDLPRIGIVLSGKERERMRVTAVLLVLANWLYLIVTL